MFFILPMDHHRLAGLRVVEVFHLFYLIGFALFWDIIVLLFYFDPLYSSCVCFL